MGRPWKRIPNPSLQVPTDLMSKSLNDEGSITTIVNATDADWMTNDRDYHFQPVDVGLIRCEVNKYSDGLLSILITGLGKRKIEFTRPVPPVDKDGIHIAATWSKGEIKLFLNGALAETKILS